jgi:nitrite reductase/ring-hydroxylating ferredoxin subunit
VDVEDEVILLVNVAGTIHAMSAWCTHQGTSLALGRLNEDTHTVTCFAHLWSFDVRTGEPIWPPMAKVARGFKLRTFPVKIQGDAIYVSPIPATGQFG